METESIFLTMVVMMTISFQETAVISFVMLSLVGPVKEEIETREMYVGIGTKYLPLQMLS